MITPDVPYTQELMTLGVPNKNGIIYPKEVMEKAIAEYGGRIPVPITRNPSVGSESNLEDMIGSIEDMRVVDDKLIGTVKFYSSLLKGLDPNDFNISLSGVGTLHKGNVVKELSLVSYNIYPNLS